MQKNLEASVAATLKTSGFLHYSGGIFASEQMEEKEGEK